MFPLTVIPGTNICGRVFASELVAVNDGEYSTSLNVPLDGVPITADGLEHEVSAGTDAFGNFELRDVPAGRFFVHIDGRTATNSVPEGAFYPLVGKAWTSVPG
jgi:hypothetical protein